MARALNFGEDYLTAVSQLISVIETLKVLQDRVVQDNTLFTAYLADPQARTDLVLQDLTNASSAVTQIMFTFDSGNPPQKSFLFDLL